MSILKHSNQMRVFNLKFNKESDGCWYIDMPNYPFSHHNLMMVDGADRLCQYVAEKEGHPDYALVDVTINDNRIDGKEPDVVMTRTEMSYGATYSVLDSSGKVPEVKFRGSNGPITRAWLCPVTLLVLHCYPQAINLYIGE